MTNQPAQAEIQIEMEDAAVLTPLEQVAQVVAALLDSCPETEAGAIGTRVVLHSAGVAVTLNVLRVSADALDVMGDPVLTD